MQGLSEILNKLSVDDIEKMRMLFSIGTESSNKDVVTLRVFCKEYEDYIKNNRSLNYYKTIIASFKHLTNYFGLQRSLPSITYKDAEMFITHLQKNVKKGYRVYYRTIKASFNKAVDWHYVKENHFVKVKLPKKNKLNPLFINENELNKILQHINAEVVSDFVVFAFNTGMRINEIVNLKWRNVDFDKKVIVVGDEEFTTKGKNQRYIPFSEEVIKIIEKRKTRDEETWKPTPKMAGKREEVETERGENEKNEKGHLLSLVEHNNMKNRFVFYKDKLNDKMNVPYSSDYFSRTFKYACRDAGMDEGIHFNTLRHSFASNLAQKGVSLYVIKELLGHSSISTTEIYSHLNVESLRNAVEKLNVETANVKNEKAKIEMNVIHGNSDDKNEKEEIPHQVRNDSFGALRLVVNNRNN